MRNRLAYWMHQLVEYVLGLALLSSAAREKHAIWPAVGGVAVVLAAALGDAPLSAFRTVPRRVHRVVDIVIGVALVALGVFVADGGGPVLLVAVGVLLLALALVTDFRARVPRTPFRDRLPDAQTAGRMAGRATGRAIAAGRARRRTRR